MAPMLKLFYTIGQAAALLGVSVVTVRRYTESKIHCTRKPGLRKLIALVLARKVKRLVIMHKDRLLRFANDLLLDLCRHLGVEVVVLRHEEKDAQAQWCESIVEIMTVFCSSLYGKRSHKNRRAAAVQLAP